MVIFRIIYFWLKRTELRLAQELMQFAKIGGGTADDLRTLAKRL